MKQITSYTVYILLSLLILIPSSYVWVYVVNSILSNGNWEMLGILIVFLTAIPVFLVAYGISSVIYGLLATKYDLQSINKLVVLIVLMAVVRLLSPGIKSTGLLKLGQAPTQIELSSDPPIESVSTEGDSVAYRFNLTINNSGSEIEPRTLKFSITTYKNDGTPMHVASGDYISAIARGESTHEGTILLSQLEIKALKESSRSTELCLLDSIGSMILCAPSNIKSKL